MSRPRFEFTEDQIDQIERLAAVLTVKQMADYFGISERTFLNRRNDDARVSAAYKKGRAAAIAAIGGSLLQQAQSGNITAMIFYLKTQAGWRDKVEVEHSGNPEIVVRTE